MRTSNSSSEHQDLAPLALNPASLQPNRYFSAALDAHPRVGFLLSPVLRAEGVSSPLALSTALCRGGWPGDIRVLTLQVSRLWLRFISIPTDLEVALCSSYTNTNAVFPLFRTENILSSVLINFRALQFHREAIKREESHRPPPSDCFEDAYGIMLIFKRYLREMLASLPKKNAKDTNHFEKCILKYISLMSYCLIKLCLRQRTNFSNI